MKKLILLGLGLCLLSGCVGFVENKAANGKTVHDMYILHPAITITGYTSGL
ncbi:MAG: DUF4223 family protein [Alphaproteobacteria bacterium]|nr:DUF4223 family protein [Alphaproteobacteria bacterium]